VKYKPGLIGDLSGKLGAIVASHNTYGTYLRSRVRPVNKKTLAQQDQRQAISAVSQMWRQLSAPVGSSWTSAVITSTSKKGDRVALSGQAAFMKCNVLRYRAGVSIINSPPVDPTPIVLTPPTIAFTSANAVDLTFAADAWNATDGCIIVSGGLITSSGVSFKQPINAITILVDPGTGAVSVTLPFAVPVGGRVRFVLHASGPDGRQSTRVSVDATNPSFTPTPPAAPSVTRVHLVDPSGGRTVWTFSAPTIPGSHGISAFQISGVSPTDGLQVSPTEWLTTHAPPPTVGDPWHLASPDVVVPAAVAPFDGHLT